MKKDQDRIKAFNDARGWTEQKYIKDLLLNMSEEIGEFWNIIKWVDDKTQERLIRENREEVENFIGDMVFLVLKVSHLCDVDPQKAIDDVMDEYEKRFPIDKVKNKHTNVLDGGVDLKGEV